MFFPMFCKHFSIRFAGHGPGHDLRIEFLPTGTPRPVSRTPVGLFEKFLLWGVPGNNTQWGNPFAAILGHWGLIY